VKISHYADPSVFETLSPEWNALVERSIANTVFSTVEWLSNWWAAYQPGELWVVTLREGNSDAGDADTGKLLGIAPWFIETTAEGERVLRGVGCIEVTDYVDCILDQDCTEPLYALLSHQLLENADRYDRICLCNIPETSPTHTQFASLLKRQEYQTQIEVEDVCPVIPLPETWDAYLEQLDKRNRHELRRKLRRSGAEAVDWYIVDESHDLQAELDAFLRLMADSSPEKAQFLQDPQNEDFFRRVMPVMAEKGWLHLIFLTVNGERAAAYLDFDYQQRILVYNSGFSQKYVSMSAGIILLANHIRYAIENGYTAYDFLRGNEEYKYRLGGVDEAVYQLNALKPD
jgi:CelD/BcsL family acetyltransferase involved in cellulose biosynthesis